MRTLITADALVTEEGLLPQVFLVIEDGLIERLRAVLDGDG